MFSRKKSITILSVVLLLTLSANFVKSGPNDFSLTILHSNDMHARFLPIDSSLKSYLAADSKISEGFGGFARISQVVKEHRQAAKNGNVLYLDAGDVYVGSRWFNLFKHKVTADFMNILKPDAMCLGNHEFDHGTDALIPFLNRVKFPILFANMNNKTDNPLRRVKSVMPSVVLKVSGYKIGIIGYLTPETKNSTSGCDVDITPEIAAINQEAKILKKDGVQIIIALGHSGFRKDLKIAANCPFIDLVVGGHTHKFLYTGQQPDTEEPDASYPTVVKQKNGKQVPVVTAFAYTKYLGKLELQYDKKEKRFKKFAGNPILLNSGIRKDPQVTALELEYRKKEADITGEPIGRSKIHLSDFRCRAMECALGNLITDSIVKSAMANLEDISFISCVALVTSGSICGELKAGYITEIDLNEVIPFDNEFIIVKISGEKLLQALEYSVRKYCEQRFIGSFLQMSGLRVVFDVARESGKRVVSADIYTFDSKYERIDSKKEYNVIITSFMFKNKNGFYMFGDCEARPLSIKVTDAFRTYVESIRVINPKPVHEGRITVLNEPPLPADKPPLHQYN
ncbi:protein 5NUC-like [Contarinia nasturtii]|uniref:protein 5NUC-like n=1 Tax=Contarinia nasturtii TaxID=265458 RepID=UPI0012D3D0AD|nr:protein 5NUC-like [Contarinia nasturtii]